MSIIYLTGEKVNAIENAEEKVVSSEDTLFTKDRAYDGFPGYVFKFLTGVDQTYDIDLNNLLNGDFDDWAIDTIPDYWEDESTGNGYAEEETSLAISGSSLKLIGSGSASHSSRIVQNIELPAGSRITLDARLHGDGIDYCQMRVFNATTSEWLTSGNVWQDSFANHRLQITSGWSAANPVTIDLPSFSTTRHHLLTIKVTFYDEGTGFVDNAYIYPHINFASVHGHNLTSNIVMILQYDDNISFTSPTNIQMNIIRPTFYKTFDLTGERYWRFFASGSNYSDRRPPKYGELVLGRSTTMGLDFQPDSEVTFKQPRIKSTDFQPQIINLSDEPVREYSLDFIAITETQKNEIRDEILVRSAYGRDPLIIVPDDNNTDVIYGRYISDNWSYVRKPGGQEAKGWYNYSIRIKEDSLDLEIL